MLPSMPVMTRLRVSCRINCSVLSSVNGAKGHPAEVSTHHSESSKAAAPVEPASHTESEEKNGKMSRLTGKLKDKLHIGSKDK
jgi:hypothetical protein